MLQYKFNKSIYKCIPFGLSLISQPSCHWSTLWNPAIEHKMQQNHQLKIDQTASVFALTCLRAEKFVSQFWFSTSLWKQLSVTFLSSTKKKTVIFYRKQDKWWNWRMPLLQQKPVTQQKTRSLLPWRNQEEDTHLSSSQTPPRSTLASTKIQKLTRYNSHYNNKQKWKKK